MKYRPGGYSWLEVAPESQFEQKIERLEDQIGQLKKEYETTKDPQLLAQIEEIKSKINQLKIG